LLCVKMGKSGPPDPPATSSARSATGCVAHGLGFMPTTSHTRDDETRRIDGSVHVTMGMCDDGCVSCQLLVLVLQQIFDDVLGKTVVSTFTR